MRRALAFGILAGWLLLAPLGAQETDRGELEALQARAGELYNEGRLEEARLVAEQALRTAESLLPRGHPEIAGSVNDLAVLYHAQGRFTEAEPLYRRALALREQSLPGDHPDIAQSVNNLAVLYHAQGRFTEAEPLYRRALALREQILPGDHPDIAQSVNNLAELYRAQGRLAEAEPLFQRALTLREQILPEGHPDVATSLDNLAELYRDQGRLAEAEPLFQRALAMFEQALPEGHPDIATSVNNLAGLYFAQGRLAEAEPLFQRALALYEQSLPEGHPYIATSVNNLAELYRAQGRLTEAEPLFQRALALREQALPEGHPAIAQSVNNLAELYRAQGRLAEAEPLHQRALAMYEQALPEGHPDIARSLNNLAALYRDQGRLAEAEPLYQRALALREQALPEGHPDIATSVNNLAALYRDQGRLAEAEPLFQRALALREQSLPESHPDIATSVNNLAELYRAQGRFTEAEPLYQRALAMFERALPEGHPAIATSVNNLAELYRAQGRLAEAEPLFQRALALREQSLPEGHPEIAQSVNNLALLYFAQGRLTEAEPLYQRALAMFERALPEGHPDIATSLDNLADLHVAQGRPTEAEGRLRRAVAILAAPGNRAQITFGLQKFDGFGHVLLSDVADRPFSAGRVAEALSAVQWPRLGVVAAAVAAASIRLAAGDPELARLVRERQDLAATRARRDAELVRALGAVGPAHDPARLTALRSELERLDGELAGRDAELASRFPAYAELAQPIPLGATAVQALLGAEEALVLLTTGIPGFVFGLTRERLAAAVLPSGAELTPLAARLRCSAAITDGGCGGGAAETRAGTPRPLRTVTEDEPGSTPFDLALAHQIYEALLGPVEDVIRDKKHLIIVADGALAGLPFHLLVKKPPEPDLEEVEAYRQAHWLIRDHTITVLPAVSSLRALRELAPKTAPAPLPFVGFGDPVIGKGPAVACGLAGEIVVAAVDGATSTKGVVRGSAGTASEALFRSGDVVNGLPVADVTAVRKLRRLPDTRCELEAIAASQGPDSAVYFDVDATESRVKALSDSGRLAEYRVVAFSTHGLVTSEAGAAEPALVLTPPAEGTTEDDGLLTASEVAALELNADWVVLSACNTAAGDGRPDAENLSGLARAFFYAGAKSILVSHWPVWSDAAVDITTRAFAAIRDDAGLGRAGALQRAMLDTLAAATDYRHAHPAYWAAFSLIGEGTG